ncbi:MAG: hypothetical protein U5L45_07555 [Saprospiraceae bacterium]|nr:hypothetical protein [Saprospiraceae bacterium]
MRLSVLLQLALFFFFQSKTTAQIGYRLVNGGRSTALSNSISGTPCAEAVFQNPASLVPITRSMATIATEMRFGVAELKPVGVGFILPTKSGVFGFSLQHFGFSAFREQKLGLAIARHFSDKLDVGIQLDYIHLQAPNYANTHLLTFEIGCNTLITKDLTLSVFVYNPLAVRLSAEERTPSVFRLGTTYRVNTYVMLALEVEKTLDNAANFSFGLDYKIKEEVSVRCGFSSLPARFSFGLGYSWHNNFVVDFGLAHQALVGSIPAVSLIYLFGKEGTEGR